MTEAWPRVALKRAGTVTYGLGQPPSLSDEGVPILRATNIQRGRITAEGLIFAAVEHLPLDRVPLLQSGEILVVRSGAYTGDSALVTPEWSGSSPGYDLRLTPWSEHEPRFLAYSLLSTPALDAIKILSTRAAQPHLNAEDLGGLRVHLPGLDDQRAIADLLDAETARIDALITKRQRQIELLAEESAALRNRLIWAGDTATTPLRHIMDPARPIMYGIVLPGPDTPGGVPIVKGGDVKRPLSVERLARTTPEIESRYRRARLREGDVLVAIRGGVGDSAIVPSDVAGANITQDVARIAPGPTVCTDWLAHAVQTSRFLADAEERITGATIRGLNIWELKRCCVPVVSMADQQVAVETLSELLGRRSELARLARRQIELLRERRQALITAGVTGQLSSATT